MRSGAPPVSAAAAAARPPHVGSWPPPAAQTSRRAARRRLLLVVDDPLTPRFELVGPPDLPLTALRFSHDRVAAFYEGPDRERAGAMIRWAVVHDMATGRHVATYGPLPHMVVCYGASGAVDQFTMLRFSDRQWQLLEATAQ